MFAPDDLLDLTQTSHRELFATGGEAWEVIGRLSSYLEQRLDSVDGELIRGEVHDSAEVGNRVFVAEEATVEANAVIQGPAWIESGTVVRSGAYLRQTVLVGTGCVLGNSSEFKNCLLFNDCEVPHFNYVGDSILGHKAHLGAGVICSNVRLDRRNVVVKDPDGGFRDTDLRKFGAIIGDRTEIGCNSVLSPGSILGRDCIVYPCTHWQGVIADRKIGKHRQDLDVIDRK